MIRRSPSLNSAVFPTYCSAMLPCLLGLSLFPRTQTFLGCPSHGQREIGIHRHLYSTIVSMQPAASVGPTSVNDMPSGHPREGANRAIKPSCWSASRRSEEHTSELQSRLHLVCRLLLEKKKKKTS